MPSPCGRSSRTPLSAESLLWLNSFLIAVWFTTGCSQEPIKPNVSDRGRQACRLESSQASTFSEAAALFQKCLSGIDARLAREAEAELAAGESAKPKPSPIPSDRYKFCFFNRAEIDRAYREQFALEGPASALERDLGRDHPSAQAARQAQRAAFARLEAALPEPMRGGLPLTPDAAEIFSRCDRADFFP